MDTVTTAPDVHKIEINYRSTPEILNLANSINLPTTSEFHKELKAVKDSNQKPVVVSVMDTYTQARFILGRIKELVEEGASYGDIAILYRAHYQSMDLQMELQRNDLPFQITSGVKFFEQAHVKDFIAQIRFVDNPLDVQAFQRITMLLPKIGEKTAVRLWKLADKLQKE